MELRVLRYFLAIANTGSFSAAANVLHISQPTLSRQIMDLETELNTPLFIRTHRKLTLTPEGLVLKKRVEEILSLIEKTQVDVTKQDEIVSGNVYIGGGESKSFSEVAKVISRIQEKYPQIHFHIYSGNAEDVMEKVDKGLLDFGLLVEATHYQQYQHIALTTQDKWGLLMCKEDVLAKQEYISANQLKNINLIGSRQKNVAENMSQWLHYDYQSLSIVATYNLIHNASLLVKEKVGNALCLDKLINLSNNSELCFKELSPTLYAQTHLIWKNSQTFSKAATIFLEYMKKETVKKEH